MSSDSGYPVGSAETAENIITFQRSFYLLSGLVVKVNGIDFGPSPITL